MKLPEDEQAGGAVILLPVSHAKALSDRPIRPWVHWLLFGLILLTTTWAGAAHQGH